MQEHIRRAHPEYYLPKLPATKESFELMINTPPHERPAIDPNHANHRHHNSHHHHSNSSHSQQQQQHIQQQQQQQHSDPSGLSPAFALDNGLNSSFEAYHAFGQHDGGYYTANDSEAAAIYSSMQAQQRSSDEYRRGSLIPAASAAAALAQLHYHRPDPDWGGDSMGQVILPSLQMSPTITEADFLQNFYADQSNDMKTHFHVDPALEDPTFMHDGGGFPVSSSAADQGGVLLPSSLARSPPDRPSTLPPLHRSLSRQYNRPRKSSLTQQARLPKHERKKSKELNKRLSGDRKSFGGEPSAAALYGKRWEDLIDAAASATEEDNSRDLTPVSDSSMKSGSQSLGPTWHIQNSSRTRTHETEQRGHTLQIPASPYASPQVASRTSLPPFALGSQFQSFQASPLNRALTPPPADSNLDLQPFPSVDSSLDSAFSPHSHHHSISHHHQNSSTSTGSQFHIMNPASLTTPSDSSPLFSHPASATTNNNNNPTNNISSASGNLATAGSSSAHAASSAGTARAVSEPVQIYCAGCRH